MLVGLNFASLKSDAGLKQLDAYLASRVYVFGFEPTTQDTTLFGLIGAAPKSGFANVTRYYNHIQTFNADAQSKFPTIDGLTVSDTPVVAAKAEAKADDSDSDDLGGMLDSDSDDDSDSVDIAAQIAKKKR